MSVECIFCITRIFIESDKSAVMQRLCSSDAATLGEGRGKRRLWREKNSVSQTLILFQFQLFQLKMRHLQPLLYII